MKIIKIDNNSTLPIIIKRIKENFEKTPNSWKLKFSKFVNVELTVFIRVRIDNLKDTSLLIPEIVRNNDKILKEITNITTDKKYLLKSSISKLILKNGSLLE